MTDFSEDDIDKLRRLARAVIPPAADGDLPGADDEIVFADIVASAHPDQIPAALAAWEEGQSIADFRAAAPAAADQIAALAVQCYYRDPRVLLSLGAPDRPPFPEGFAVDPGDWTLLDPVRAKPPFYRHTPD